MNCPKCNGDTKVTGSITDEVSVERLRKCLNCGCSFTTSETLSDGKKYWYLRHRYDKYTFLLNVNYKKTKE